MKMLQEIKLVVRENNKVLETVIKETSTQPSHLVQSLKEFQRSANAALTKMIENIGGSGDTMETEEAEESDDEEDNIPVSPKKRKNSSLV